MSPRVPFAARLWGLLTGVDGTAPAGWTRPRPGRPGLIRDACAGLGIALVIAGAHWAIVGSGILSDASDLSAHQPLGLRVVAPLAFGLVVAVRRRLPVTALIMGTAVFFGFVALGYLELFVTPFVYFYILYSAGAWSSRRTLVTVLRLVIAAGACVAMIVNLASLSPDAVRSLNIEEPTSFGIWASIIHLLFYLGGTWLGNSEYLRAGQRATMDAQVAQLHASRAQLADQAVRLDRIRIARELHDSVAHHVSLMGVQAAVARRTLEVHTDAEAVPASVAAALERVETSARDAVEELQSVLVTLRSEDEDGPHASGVLDATSVPSTWTLAQVPALIGQVRASGMDVVLHEEGDPDRDTMSTVELTVYRVLQEALTNVRKHGGPGATVQVRIRHVDQRIELEVTDDGRGVHGAWGGGGDSADGQWSDRTAASGVSAVLDDGAGLAESGGRGILGMEERAQAVGGTLRAGPRPEGGFRVLLRVPTRGGVRLDAGDAVDASDAMNGREAGRP